MSRTLGLDLSTQSCTALVIDDAEGSIHAHASVHFGEDLPQYGAPSGFIPGGTGGEVHADPKMWLDGLELLLERLADQTDLSEIAAISGAAQQHGSVYLNEQWELVLANLREDRSLAEQIAPCLSRSTSPIWMDSSTGRECREIAEALGGNAVVCEKSGSSPAERFTGPQIRRFHKTDPEAYERTRRIHLVSSFFCSLLTGTDAAIDTGDGAGMNLLNIQNWDWDPELLQATAPELAERLPAVRPGATTAGTLAPCFTRKYGFKENTAVTLFTGDNPSSLVGMGAGNPGKIVVSLGTSDTFFAAMPRVVADPEACGHVFGNPMGGCMSLQCFANGSLAREAVKDKFGYDWDAFSQALANTPPGNNGACMLPFFRPEISPRLDINEPRLAGSESFRNWKEPETAIRACVEGQCLNIKHRTAWMGLQAEAIHLTGGASQNDAIAQVFADVFQARVERLQTSDSVALGAALRAAHNELHVPLADLEAAFCRPDATGTVLPDPSTEAAYKSLGQTLESLVHP
ncbi:MAG: xylulokinase [Opitutales bacterium]